MSLYLMAGRAPRTMKAISITSIVRQAKYNGNVQSALPLRPCQRQGRLSVAPRRQLYRLLPVTQMLHVLTRSLAGAGDETTLHRSVAVSVPRSARGPWDPATTCPASGVGARIADIGQAMVAKAVTGAVEWSVPMASYGSVDTAPATVWRSSGEWSAALQLCCDRPCAVIGQVPVQLETISPMVAKKKKNLYIYKYIYIYIYFIIRTSFW